jgi:hypothetical protein
MALAACPLYGEAAEQPPPTPAQEQPEVLTRGPVHEAFAEPVDLQVQAGLVAPSQPPANIEENLPAERPTGGQFVWVPGYWAWDGERNSYIWVSGCWRAAPPNRYWVPGYWAKVPDGWEWIPGFWALVTDVQQIEYLPAPPALVDVQPPGLPPSPDNIWAPPCWYWYQGRYIWRPGYWLVAQAGWVWVPSHYVWTPRGYVFVAGHWDYSLERRGVLFAPVYIPRHLYERPRFSLSLGVVVDIGMLQFSMFTCPRYSHYYFGDYYDDIYIGIGIYPRFECERRHTWYDPIYEHDRWRHRRTEPRWEEHERHEYDIRRADKDLRPPRTYHEMETRQSRMPESQRRDIQIAEPLSTVVTDKKAQMKFEPIKTDARQKLTREATDVHKFSEERNRWESAPAGPKTVQPPSERKGPVTPPTGRGESVTPPTERKGPAMPSSERREQATPSAERKEQATPSAERREQVTPSTERKSTFAPPREVNRTQSERVKIPSPPIVGRKSGLGIFGKGPPSRPAGEQKAEVKSTPRGADAPKDRDTPRNNDTPRGRGPQRDRK